MTLTKAELKKLDSRLRPKTTQKQRDEAVHMYAGGATLAVVAKKYGVSIPTVHGWVTRARIRAREAK